MQEYMEDKIMKDDDGSCFSHWVEQAELEKHPCIARSLLPWERFSALGNGRHMHFGTTIVGKGCAEFAIDDLF